MILKKVFDIFAPKEQSKLRYNLDLCYMESSSGDRLLIFVENIDATYYLTFHYILQLLYRQNRINFCVVSRHNIEKNWIDPASSLAALIKEIRPSIVIFSRYGLPHGKLIQQQCQLHNLPTVYHIDDNLLEIPTSLGTGVQKQHGNNAVIQEREYLLARTDLIYTSTEYLAKTLARRFPDRKVYYGVYPPYLASSIQKNKSTRSPATKAFKFGYMGSKGHGRDLAMITDAIARILTEYPGVTFETFGTIALPESLKMFGDRVISHKVKANYEQFLQYLYELNWDLGLAPLEDTEFNKCKAPNKYIEYTACQIPTLASNVLVYNKFVDGREIAITESDCWYEKIKFFLENSHYRASLVESAQKRCAVEFNLKLLEPEIERVISLASGRS